MALLPVDLLGPCARVVAQTSWIDIDQVGVEALADRVAADRPEPPGWDAPLMFQGPDEQVAAWLLAYNAVNFSYYPEPGDAPWYPVVDGTEVGRDDAALGVMAAFAQALRDGVPLGDGAWLAELDDLDRVLPTAPGAGPLPLRHERLRGLREMGRAWQRAGGPLELVAGSSATAVVERLVHECPTWDDRRTWRGELIPFRKRAQLCVAMLHERLGTYRDIDRLTVFADYRLPQILRGAGVLLLHEGLAARIDAGEPIPYDSAAETSLRAATVVAGERLRRALEERGVELEAVVVDYWLWSTAVADQGDLPAHHRTRCTDY